MRGGALDGHGEGRALRGGGAAGVVAGGYAGVFWRVLGIGLVPKGRSPPLSCVYVQEDLQGDGLLCW